MNDLDGLIDRIVSLARLDPARCRTRIIASRPAVFAETLPELSPELRSALEKQGITRLYTHQSEAIGRFQRGENVLLSTPTASGKSLCYQIPTLDTIARDQASTFLYLFPYKALAHDQLSSINQMADCIPWLRHGPLAQTYDGDTSSAARTKIRQHPPSILISNPDLIHYNLLPNHTKWKSFLERLRLIVLDELHVYRGAFGSHVLQVFRRLDRILKYYGANPQWITCSATIGNPQELAELIAGRPFSCIESSGAPATAKGFISYLPEDSVASISVRLFEASIRAGMKTIVFAKARRTTELMFRMLSERNHNLTRRTAVYRAGYLQQERREIEQRLFSDRLDGVISTSALELGIDIGGLDCCILSGFPGSVASLWQRAGRVGRSRRPSIVVFVAGEDALDRYWYEHEDALHRSPVERVVVYRTNDAITDRHLECAADELPIKPGLNFEQTGHDAKRIESLTVRNLLLETAEGGMYLCASPHPQRNVNLRSGGDSYDIVLDDGQAMGTVDGVRVYKECHEGAIYLHGGRIYRVRTLDRDNFRVVIEPGPDDIYTQSTMKKETDIIETAATSALPSGCRVSNGRLRVRERVTGYTVRRIITGDVLSRADLDLPEISFETQGLWITFDARLIDALRRTGKHPMGGLHALEHAMIGLYPLVSLCDRSDLAGISTSAHKDTSSAAVFIYDSFSGGLGLAESSLPRFDELLRTTLEVISRCPCENGCPACIQSPKCGSGNEPLDKTSVLFLLDALVSGKEFDMETTMGPLFDKSSSEPVTPHSSGDDTGLAGIPPLPPESDCPAGTRLVFDIETQLSADEVGGWQHSDRMKVAIAVVYDIDLNRYEFYCEKDVPRLIRRLAAARLIIGYNSDRFDLKVVSGYAPDGLPPMKSLDLLRVIMDGLGHRVSLNDVATATLDAEKSADGLQSLRWWKQGRMDLIAEYCRKDVEITYRVYQYGLDNGYVLYVHRTGMKAKVRVEWNE